MSVEIYSSSNEEESRKLDLQDSKSDFNSSHLSPEKSSPRDLLKNTPAENISIERASDASKEINFKLKDDKQEVDTTTKRELLKKLAKVCGLTFYSNISTIEFDLEEYVKETLENATNGSHNIQIREDGRRAGEEITLYDSKNKTMYHTAFSRLTRKEIESMLSLVKKFDSSGKYSAMRILPHSLKQIHDALEKAKIAKTGSQTKQGRLFFILLKLY